MTTTKFIKKSTLTIPLIKWEGIGDWLIERFLEEFGDDELITEYLTSNRKQFNKAKYTSLAMGETLTGFDWVISIEDYQAFLDRLYQELPPRFRKKWSEGKPWFMNVMPMVDMGMGPLTFEAADKKQEEKKLAITKEKSQWQPQNEDSQVVTYLDSLESLK